MFDIFSLQSRFYCAQAPLEVPQPDGAPKTYPPNITSIVDQISKLTLMEVADLNSCLKVSHVYFAVLLQHVNVAIGYALHTWVHYA